MALVRVSFVHFWVDVHENMRIGRTQTSQNYIRVHAHTTHSRVHKHVLPHTKHTHAMNMSVTENANWIIDKHRHRKHTLATSANLDLCDKSREPNNKHVTPKGVKHTNNEIRNITKMTFQIVNELTSIVQGCVVVIKAKWKCLTEE